MVSVCVDKPGKAYCSEWCNAGEGKPGLHWGCGGGKDDGYECSCAGCNGCPNLEQCEDGRPNGNYCSEWCNTPEKWGCGTPIDPNTKYQCSCSGCNGCVDGVAGIPTCGTDVGGTNYCDDYCNRPEVNRWDCGIGYNENAGVPGGYQCDCDGCHGCPGDPPHLVVVGDGDLTVSNLNSCPQHFFNKGDGGGCLNTTECTAEGHYVTPCNAWAVCPSHQMGTRVEGNTLMNVGDCCLSDNSLMKCVPSN
jgi:hypothetical protein